MMILRDIQKIKKQIPQNIGYKFPQNFLRNFYSILRALTPSGMKYKPSSNLKVGDIIEINANQRVPADLLLLHTSSNIYIYFIKKYLYLIFYKKKEIPPAIFLFELTN